MIQKYIFRALSTLLLSAIIIHCYAFFIQRNALSTSGVNYSEHSDLIYKSLILKNYGRLTYLILGLACLNFFVFFRYSEVNRKIYRLLIAFTISLSFIIIELII